MSVNEKTSERVGSLAARALREPTSITYDEIKILAASVLTQRPDKEQPKSDKITFARGTKFYRDEVDHKMFYIIPTADHPDVVPKTWREITEKQYRDYVGIPEEEA